MNEARSYWVVLLLVLSLAGRCMAVPAGINVLSTEHRVYAEFVGYGFYDYVASFPLDESLHLDIGAQGSYSDPRIRTTSSSGIAFGDPDYHGLHAYVSGRRGYVGFDPDVPPGWADDRIPGPEGYGRAEATVMFMPVGNILQFEHYWFADGDYSAGGSIGMKLEDVTAGVTLPPGEWDYLWGWFAEYRVNPSHVYRATVWVEMWPTIDYYFYVAGCNMGSYGVIPVPGAVMLAGIGVGLIGWLRRRKAM